VSNFAELTSHDCPLLGDAAAPVVARFNEAVRVLREIEQKYPRLLEREGVQGRAQKLEAIRSRLERKRYLVGFLGRTQDGKSTAFNNILDASEAEAPSQGGVSGATTSAITRVRRKASGDHTLLLSYLTPEQFQAKRKKLIDAVGLNTAFTDEQILGCLPKHRVDLRIGSAAAPGGATGPHHDKGKILTEDLNALEYLLRSYNLYKDIVQKPANERDVPYPQRGQYLNHAPTSGKPLQPSPTFLLRDALIEFNSDQIPDNLEIIDLPGVGSQGSIDTLLTEEFLRHLDGALVFLRAGQLDSADVDRILNRLHLSLGNRLTGRVWVILTFFDGLEKQHFFGNPNGQTMLDALAKFLGRHQIPTEQVCFSSKRFYEASKPDSRFKLEALAAMMGLQGATVEEIIPPRFKAIAPVGQAFKELLEDGGIGRLRRLLADVLAKEVANETRQHAERELPPLIEELRDDLQVEARRKALDQTEFQNAVSCLDRVDLLVIQWRGRVLELEPLGLELKNALLAEVDKILPQEDRILKESSPAELRQRLEFLAKRLRGIVDQQMDTGILDKAFAQVASRLADLPAVRLWNDAGPLHAWERFGREDRRGQEWRSGFPEFTCQRLFAEGLVLEQRSEYRLLIREKVRTASHQALHAVKVRIQGRLRELREELSKLAYQDNGSQGKGLGGR